MEINRTQNTSSKPKFNLWLITTIVLIVLLVAGGTIFAWQKIANDKVKNDLQNQINTLQNQVQQMTEVTPADETADWRTYKNELYGFELKYPQNGKVETIDAQIPEMCIEIKNTTSPYVEAYWLCVFSAEPGQTLQNYIATSDARFLSTLTVLNARQIAVEQTLATQRTEQWLGTNENDPKKNTLCTYIKNGNFVYSFHFSSAENLSSSRLNDDKKIYDTILSTFKFTK